VSVGIEVLVLRATIRTNEDVVVIRIKLLSTDPLQKVRTRHSKRPLVLFFSNEKNEEIWDFTYAVSIHAGVHDIKGVAGKIW
jgi:hypothetical protein